MLKVTNIEVRTFDLDHLDLFWSIDNTSELIEAYDFFILRSLDGMAGPFRQIAGPFYNAFQFRDPDVHQLHRWRTYYYKIRVTHRESGDTQEFGPQWLQAEPDRIALEVQRREGLMFKEIIGRFVLLYPSVTTGQRCVHCWDRGVDKGALSSELARPGNTIGRSTQQNCATCFIPGTLVRTESGYRPIEGIKIGDKVLSSDGEFHSVTQTFQNHFDGDLIMLRSSTMTGEIGATPEHPFQVMGGSHETTQGCGPICQIYVDRGDGVLSRNVDVRQLPSGNWHARCGIEGERFALGTYQSQEEAALVVENFRKDKVSLGHELVWKTAEELDAQDWLTAKWPIEVRDVAYVDVPKDFTKDPARGPKRKGPSRFRVDEEFLWIIGLYLAEGSPGTRAITFSLHKDEVDFQERVKAFFESHGYRVRLDRRDGNGVAVVINSAVLADWFPTWLGKGCYFKRIPEELMLLPNGKSKALIKGIYDGDGTKKFNEITQTSKILTLQLVELLHRLDLQPLVRQQRSNILTPNGNQRALAFPVNWRSDTLTHTNRKWRWSFGREQLTRIRELRRQHYKGVVHNLEVDGPHDYVVEGVVTHNCFDTTFVGGYATPMRIHMQIDPYATALQKTDIAERQFTETTARTTAYPPIKPKDLVIEAENIRWRVESPVTSTEKLRATVRQELKLRQYPRGDIKYKVPVDSSMLQAVFSPPREYSRPMTVPAIDPRDARGKYSQPEIEGHGPFWWEGSSS